MRGAISSYPKTKRARPGVGRTLPGVTRKSRLRELLLEAGALTGAGAQVIEAGAANNIMAFYHNFVDPR
jgi:hypothetical protein